MTPEIRILDGLSRYDVFRNWQPALRNGFDQIGIRASVVPVGWDHEPGSNGHTVTLGFNLVRQWSVSNLQRPHFAWTVDHPNYFGNFFLTRQGGLLVNPDCCALGCVDYQWAQFAREVYGFPHMSFLPHAAVQSVATEPDWSSRKYDAVFFGSLEQPEKYVEALHRKALNYAPPTWPLIQIFLDHFRYGNGISLARWMWDTMRANHWPDDIRLLFLNAFFPDADSAHRYRNRMETFRSIRHHTVHVFGMKPWREIGLLPNVVVHDEVPYSEALNIMKQARVLLNHAPTLTGGGHERVFDALLSGCFVVSTGSEFLAAEFPGGEGVRFYSGEKPEIDELLDAVLTDPESCDRVRAAQKTVLLRHTMSNRAVEIITLIQERWPDRFGSGNS
jgi:spore maturation protein CgeB